LIKITDLRKTFGEKVALAGVSLEVKQGEVFGFVGPNGAGKSTLLKSVLGVIRPDSGQIQIGLGKDQIDGISNPVAAQRLIGYSPGETALYQHQRAASFLRFAISFHPNADLELGMQLLEQFGLPPKQKIKGFSHGMKRKMLLTQALASQAPILMLDEPMEGLDPDARRTVEGMLVEAARSGRTVFYSSHDLSSVERICDRVAFLRSGLIMETGSVTEILERASHFLHLTFRKVMDAGELPSAAGVQWKGSGARWRMSFSGSLQEAMELLPGLPIAGIRDGAGRLEDVFETLYGPDPASASMPESAATEQEDASC
jgi:ABC-2 type transport system ATP-binding protein